MASAPGLTAMGIFLSGSGLSLFLPGLAIALVLAGFLLSYWRGRAQSLRRNTDVFWFSSLHFFGKELSECRDPQQMADHSVRGAIEMLGADKGFILLQGETGEGTSFQYPWDFDPGGGTAPEGFHRAISAVELRPVGDTDGFPRRAPLGSGGGVGAGPDFHEFRDVMRNEGSRTLVVVGMQVQRNPTVLWSLVFVAFATSSPRSCEWQWRSATRLVWRWKTGC